MAMQKTSVLARIQASVAKVVVKEEKKRDQKLTAVKTALEGVAGVEYFESGKTTIVALNGAKVGAVNAAINAFAALPDGKVGHVRVSAKELAEYVKELAARK